MCNILFTGKFNQFISCSQCNIKIVFNKTKVKHFFAFPDSKRALEREKLTKELTALEAKANEVDAALGESSNRRTVATRVNRFCIHLCTVVRITEQKMLSRYPDVR